MLQIKEPRSIRHTRYHKAKHRKSPPPPPHFPFSPLSLLSLTLSHYHFFFLFLSLICSLLYIFTLYVKYFLCSFGCIYVYIDDTYLVWQNMLAPLFQFWSSPCPILMQQMMLHCIFYVRVIFIY